MPLTLDHMRRALPALVPLVVVAALGFGWLARGRDAAGDRAFVTARVSRGDIIRTVNATGQLTPLVSVEVSTQVTAGLITEVAVDFNSRVRKGQVLARIDPSTFEQRLRQAQANLAAGRASHRLAALNAQRLRSLGERELITAREGDEAAALLRQAQASLLALQAEVENARVELERCTITSPIDGVVIFRQAEVGRTVVSSLSAPTLFTIARDLSRMRIIAPINEVDVGSVEPGQPVTFTVDAIPQRRFHGRVAQIRNPYTPSDRPPPTAQQGAPATFDGVIEVDNADLALRPSLTANVSIEIDSRRAVLRVPNGALRVRLAADAPSRLPQGEGAASIYRLTGASRVPRAAAVVLGITDGTMTELISGLSEGEEIVIAVSGSPSPGPPPAAW